MPAALLRLLDRRELFFELNRANFLAQGLGALGFAGHVVQEALNLLLGLRDPFRLHEEMNEFRALFGIGPLLLDHFRVSREPLADRVGAPFPGQVKLFPNVRRRDHSNVVRRDNVDLLDDFVMAAVQVVEEERPLPAVVEFGGFHEFHLGRQGIGRLRDGSPGEIDEVGKLVHGADVADAAIVRARRSHSAKPIVQQGQAAELAGEDLLAAALVVDNGLFLNDFAVDGVAVLEDDHVAAPGDLANRQTERRQSKQPQPGKRTGFSWKGWVSHGMKFRRRRACTWPSRTCFSSPDGMSCNPLSPIGAIRQANS